MFLNASHLWAIFTAWSLWSIFKTYWVKHKILDLFPFRLSSPCENRILWLINFTKAVPMTMSFASHPHLTQNLLAVLSKRYKKELELALEGRDLRLLFWGTCPEKIPKTTILDSHLFWRSFPTNGDPPVIFDVIQTQGAECAFAQRDETTWRHWEIQEKKRTHRKRNHRGIPLYSYMLESKWAFPSEHKTTSQSLQCYSAHLIRNSPKPKDFHLIKKDPSEAT